MKRALWTGAAALIAVAIVSPFLDAGFARPRIERALKRGLGRRVEIGRAYFSLFAGPGFTLEDVTIGEDPRAGIEPFAHVPSLGARVSLLGLLSRRLEFSNLTLGADTTINLVKTAAGPWNFQLLLGSAPAMAGAMPSIKMRGGRVNFKFGDSKSVFYFDDADFNISRSGTRSMELRFSGAPARTDRAGQDFGHFFVRGTWDPSRLDFNVELEPSSIDEVARLFDRGGFGLHGLLGLEARISGPPSKIEVAGQLQLT
ncbi:MAG: AsmA family protein, partial [Bryobacteraceae bacterium]